MVYRAVSPLLTSLIDTCHCHQVDLRKVTLLIIYMYSAVDSESMGVKVVKGLFIIVLCYVVLQCPYIDFFLPQLITFQIRINFTAMLQCSHNAITVRAVPQLNAIV